MYKILIVEDDDTITAVLTRTFLKWNYEVQAVVDFGRVGEQFAQFSPDLVLLDISLPFFDGYYWVPGNQKDKPGSYYIYFICGGRYESGDGRQYGSG